MKKISCNVYEDLLPLYVDGVVSQDTKEFVEEHLEQCENCRREVEHMTKPLTIPAENSTKPLEEIKKQWSRQNSLIWGLSLALLSIFLVMALPIFDTAMQYHMQELIGGGITSYIWLLLLPGGVSFGIEWWCLHRKKMRWLSFILMVLSTGFLIGAEIAWAAGGFDRILSSLLWIVGFPVLLGAGSATLLKAALDQPRWIKMSLAGVLSVFVFLSVIYWPRTITDVLELEPDLTMMEIYDDGSIGWRTIEEEALMTEIQFAKTTRCEQAIYRSTRRSIVLRLNNEYVVVASPGYESYVCRYSGPLEEFNGEKIEYQLYHYTALYNNLKTASKAVQE